MAGTQLTPIGEVCRVVGGTTPSTANPAFWDGDIVWVTPADLGKLADGSVSTSHRQISKEGFASCGLELVPEGSVVISSRAPIGHLAIARVPLCTNQGCKSLVPGNRIRSDYLYWALKYRMEDLKKLGSGATFTEVSKSQINAFGIPIPSLEEQGRIAARLEEQMAAVAKARRAAEERLDAINALPAALLREAFGGSS